MEEFILKKNICYYYIKKLELQVIILISNHKKCSKKFFLIMYRILNEGQLYINAFLDILNSSASNFLEIRQIFWYQYLILFHPKMDLVKKVVALKICNR